MTTRAIRCCLAALFSLAQTAAAQVAPTAILNGLQADARRPIDFHAAALPETVFVGQQITYQVAVLLNASAKARLRRNPEFLPPELRGLLAYELGSPRHVAPRAYGAGTFEAHVFQRALFGVAPGRTTIPSPQLGYALAQSASYFSREERVVLRADSVTVVIRPLPLEGQPADFSGTVGIIRASTRASTDSARVGDVVVLTVRLEGVGNVKLWSRPSLDVSWGSVVDGSERLQIDSAGSEIRGSKEFDYLVTPIRSGAVMIPVVRYSYFNPRLAAYAIAETRPADLVVAAGRTPLDAASEDEEAVVPLRAWRRSETHRLEEWPRLWQLTVLLLVLVAPMPWGLRALQHGVRRRREGGDRERGASPRLGASTLQEAWASAMQRARLRSTSPDSPLAPTEAQELRRNLLGLLADALELSPQALVGPGDAARQMRRSGVTRQTATEVDALLDALALAGFGGGRSAGGDGYRATVQRVETLIAQVRAERTHRLPGRLRGRGITTLGVILVAGLLMWRATPLAALPLAEPASRAGRAARADSSAVLVEEATAAYDARRFRVAADRFALAVQLRPRDTDLLVNWGIAAWAAEDTVAAVRAWHLAARRTPMAADLQALLRQLPPGARDGVAAVPMVPVTALVALATTLWLFGWLLLLTHRGRALASLLVVLAIGAGGTAWWGMHRLDTAPMRVIVRPETLRVAPGMDANALGGTGTGDLVRQMAVREAWLRVRHADGRLGWIPAVAARPLHEWAGGR